MYTEEIVEKIKGFLAQEFEIDENLIFPEANLKNTLDLDSLDYIDLVVIIESNFSFKVKPEDLAGIVTFQDLYDYVLTNCKVNELV